MVFAQATANAPVHGGIFGVLTGVFGVSTGGLALFFFQHLKAIGDGKKAIDAMIQVPAVVQIFLKSLSPTLQADPSYQELLGKLYTAFTDTAVTLEDLGLVIEASKLRSVIQSNGNVYTLNTIFTADEVKTALKTAIDTVKAKV
jgi:hypothetical protein